MPAKHDDELCKHCYFTSAHCPWCEHEAVKAENKRLKLRIKQTQKKLSKFANCQCKFVFCNHYNALVGWIEAEI